MVVGGEEEETFAFSSIFIDGRGVVEAGWVDYVQSLFLHHA